MSPRAASRLEQLGFAEVHDYVPGKQDWLAFNLPSDGAADLVGAHLRTDVTTCGLRQPLSELDLDPKTEGKDMAVVLDEAGVVAGVVAGHALVHSADQRAEDAMTPGPTTVRPSEERELLEERMRHAGVHEILVTSSDGRLLGLFVPSG